MDIEISPSKRPQGLGDSPQGGPENLVACKFRLPVHILRVPPSLVSFLIHDNFLYPGVGTPLIPF